MNSFEEIINKQEEQTPKRFLRITFDINNPDEKMALDRALKSEDAFLAFQDISDYFRYLTKHNPHDYEEPELQIIEMIKDKIFCEILSERKLLDYLF